MSDNNDINLLDDDLGDDADYDLGNEDEDALLADDYDPLDITVQTSYAANESTNVTESQDYEEPLDDVLDIGGTDEDDLDSDILDGLDHSRNVDKSFTNHDSVRESKNNSADSIAPNTVSSTNVSKDESINAEEHLESEEEEENEERDRFKSERTNIVSVKSSKTVGNIPDSLDNVIAQEEVPVKKKKFNARNDSWRGRRAWQGVGRGPSGNSRGGGNVHARYHQQASRQNYLQQKPQPFLPYPESSAFAARGLDVPNFPRIPPSDLPIQQPPPHKILINPHFRGAVQPHPDARLVWDTEPPINNGFSQRMMVSEQLGQGYESSVHSNHLLHDGHSHGHGQNFGHPVNQQSLQPPPFYQDSYMDHSLPPDHWLGGGPPMHSQSSINSQQGDPYYMQSREQMMFQSQQQFPPYQDQLPRYQHQGPVQEPMPMQPNVWQNNIQPGPPKLALPIVPQHYSPNQEIFRMPQSGGPNMGMSARFRHPTSPRFSNFNQKNRPRFQGRPNGPKNVRHPAPKLQQQQPLNTVQNQPVQPVELPKPPQHLQQNMTVVPVHFETNVKRKKQRMPDMNNLHEVKTVDTLPTVKVEEKQQEEPEDEETRAYRLKIEEQKRLREQLLQVKEERRKQAALEKQRLLKQQQTPSEPTGPPPTNADTMESMQGIAIATIVNRNLVAPTAPATQKVVVNNRGRGARGRGTGLGRGAGLLGHAPSQQLPPLIQTAQTSTVKKVSINSVPTAPPTQGQRLVRTGAQNVTQGTVVTSAPATPTQPAQNNQQQVRKVVLRGASSGTGAIKRAAVPQKSQQRVVIQAPQPPAQGAVPGRVVVAGPTDNSAASQPRQSMSVCVDNLSADTDEMKLRQMCLRVGTVEKVQMQPEQCRAIITFTKPAAAANFINRYQRKMVDLSLISVSLV